MNWPLKPLGNFLSESRIISTNPSVERRIRVRLNAEGVEKRPVVVERKGVTRYFLRHSGQFIYGKQNLHKGAFGVIPKELDGFESSSDLPAFDVSEDMRPKWIEYFFKQGNCYKTLVAIAKGAATKRIQPKALFDVHIPSPPVHIQDELISQMDACCSEQAKMLKELARQETLLAKLKQAILHEAIRGELTADWRRENPDVEPASQLLERIRREKQRLVAEKKIRKEKPLPPIAPEEIPFEIPEGWAWCRMLSISENIHYGLTASADFSKQNIRLLRITDIQDGRVNWDSVPGCQCSPKKKENYSLRKGDILIARTGGTVGKSFLVEDLDCEAVFASYLVRLIPIYNSISFYLKQYLGSPPYWNQLKNATIGAQPNVSGTKLKKLVVPIPPLAEQAIIVERVESLMDSCRQLEAEIGHSHAQAENLLQAVLKEAFAPKTV